MDLSETFNAPPRRPRKRPTKEIAVVVLVLGFFGLYQIPPVSSLLDKVINPAVAGIALSYGKLSTFIYRKSGINLGFISIPPDPQFLFSVQLATYINQKQAAPLFNMASDVRLTIDKRERALISIEKFEEISDWIQPFLNELPKGGLLGLYEPEAPLLDNLIRKIRAHGGVRQDLVRAYAEVVFSFMLQVPDSVVRQHALKWVTDVLAEDALFLIIPRFERENDPEVRKSIDDALLNLRAVSDQKEAVYKLIPFYKKPPWPSLRLPLAVVLARLGYVNSVDYLRFSMKSGDFPKNKLVTLRVAAARTPYPKELSISRKDKTMLAERAQRREAQRQMAWQKHQRSLRQEKYRQTLLAKKSADALPKSIKEPRPRIPEQAPPEAPRQEPARSQYVSVPPAKEERVPPKPFHPPSDKDREQIPDFGSQAVVANQDEEIPEEPVVEDQPPLPDTQVASLPPEVRGMPEDFLPPPVEAAPAAPKSLMNYVDVVFEVKGKEVELFQNPGVDSPTGDVLPIGTKGKADLEVLIGEDHWYQVRTKHGNGWVNGSMLSVFNLSPLASVPVTPTEESTAEEKTLDGSREEFTYFEASSPDVPLFLKPGMKAKKIGTLSENVAYKAVKSEKAGEDRWFLLEVRSGETAWARGWDIHLAEVQQPAQMKIPTSEMSLRTQKSAFSAEWIVAGVNGVGVYSRPSIAGKMIEKISPPTVYKIREMSAGGGKEWYRIVLSGKKEGWVQAMDVNLTKPDSP